MQSGIKRKTFRLGPRPPETHTGFNPGPARGKERPISGIATDSLNKYVIVTTSDGTINVSTFSNRASMVY